MRWRFIDRIEAYEPWMRIGGRKAISLEEYHLLDVLGRKGVFPESLVLESCVHLVRWLVGASSDFSLSSTLLEVERFAFEHETHPGAVLTVTATVLDKQDDTLKVSCNVMSGNRRCGHGVITCALIPLADIASVEDSRTLWRELYGKA